MGWQEEQMDAFGYLELEAFMPARLVEDQQDALGWACANGLGELCSRNGEHIRSHCGQEHPLRLSSSRMHKTGEIEPTFSDAGR